MYVCVSHRWNRLRLIRNVDMTNRKVFAYTGCAIYMWSIEILKNLNNFQWIFISFSLLLILKPHNFVLEKQLRSNDLLNWEDSAPFRHFPWYLPASRTKSQGCCSSARPRSLKSGEVSFSSFSCDQRLYTGWLSHLARGMFAFPGRATWKQEKEWGSRSVTANLEACLRPFTPYTTIIKPQLHTFIQPHFILR